MPRILFIDDEAKTRLTIAKQYAEVLSDSLDFDATVFTELTGALKHIGKMHELNTPEDVVLLDMMMPDEPQLIAGKYLIERALRSKNYSSYERVPIIVATNKDIDEVTKILSEFDRVWVKAKKGLRLPALCPLIKAIIADNDILNAGSD